ncbi:MAG: hypothetical protein HY660_12565 [Armatimonadetes bacterium]|nr:hypothetical protein [Armatimonadota bacterium]
MRTQIWIVVILLAAGAGFVLLNPTVIARMEEVHLPGRTYQVPLVRTLLATAAAALLLLCLLNAVNHVMHVRARRHLEGRLAQREAEIAEMKSRAYDEVSQKIDALGRDLSGQIASLRDRMESRAAPTESQEPAVRGATPAG